MKALPFAAFLGGIAMGSAASYFVLTGQGRADGMGAIRAGDEVFSVLEEAVMSVTYRTTDATVTAQRSKPGASFAMQMTYADGRAPEQCLVSADLGGRLVSLTRIVAKRPLTLDAFEKEFSQQLGAIEVADSLILDPPPSFVVRAASDSGVVAILSQGRAFETDTPVDALKTLARGCAGLVH